MNKPDRFISERSYTPQIILNNSPKIIQRGGSFSLRKLIYKKQKYSVVQTQPTKIKSSFKDFLKNLPEKQKNIQIIQQPQLIKCYQTLGTNKVSNNYYSSILDWSKLDLLSIGVGSELCLLDKAENIKCLKRYYPTEITSTKFTCQGQLLCCGDDQGLVQIFDMEKFVSARLYRAHKNRIGCLEFTQSNLLITGSKDQKIHINDLRQAQPIVAELLSHKGEVCGLSFRDDYLASGGNDNKVCVWDLRVGKYFASHSHHLGAVKAISWCPYKNNILVSGGGNKDRKIVVWNLLTEQKQMQIPLKSPIQAICWRKTTQEMITAQGNKQGYLLTHNTFMQKKIRRKKFIGHQGRILGLCVNKNNDKLMCTIGSDSIIRFWNFYKNKKSGQSQAIDDAIRKQTIKDSQQHQKLTDITQMMR